jgi:hypothetical protein
MFAFWQCGHTALFMIMVGFTPNLSRQVGNIGGMVVRGHKTNQLIPITSGTPERHYRRFDSPAGANISPPMQLLNSHLYLDFADLQAYGLPEVSIKVGCMRFRKGESSSWANIPHPNDARKVLVQYNTIPDATKGKYGIPTEATLRSSLQSEREMELMQLVRDILPVCPANDLKDLQNFRIVREMADVASGELSKKILSALPEKAIREYATECRWLHLLSLPRWKQKGQRMALHPSFATLSEFTRLVLATAAADGVKLPGNAQVFKRRLKEYKTHGSVAVICKKWGNTNAQVVDEAVGARLLELMADSRKPTYELVHEWYNTYAYEQQTPRLSLTTVKNYLNRHDIKPVWTLAQHGTDYFKNHYEYQMKTQKASQPDFLWVFDGTKVNKRYRTAAGVAAKLNMMVVMDANSEMLLGWKLVAAKETQKEVGEAIRAAIQTANGRLPLQFLYDNDGSNKAFMAEYIAKYDGVAFPAKPYNGRSKPIENMFSRLQNSIMREDENFTGQNITAKSERSRQNMDAFEAKNLPTLDECMKQAAIELHAWNNMPGPDGKTPKERYAESQFTGEFRYLTPEMDCSLFWEWNEQPIKYHSYGLTMVHNGQKLVYEVMDGDKPDFKFQLENTGREFKIKYDAQSVEGRIALFGADDRFIAFAQARTEVPRALADYKEGSRKQINERLAGQDWQQAHLRERLAATQEFVKEADTDLPDALKMNHRFVPKNVMQAAENDWYAAQGRPYNTYIKPPTNVQLPEPDLEPELDLEIEAPPETDRETILINLRKAQLAALNNGF